MRFQSGNGNNGANALVGISSGNGAALLVTGYSTQASLANVAPIQITLSFAGAGHNRPVELLSVPVTGASKGSTTFTVQAGSSPRAASYWGRAYRPWPKPRYSEFPDSCQCGSMRRIDGRSRSRRYIAGAAGRSQ